MMLILVLFTLLGMLQVVRYSDSPFL